VVVLLALTAGAALAATTITCPNADPGSSYTCVGTPDADTMNGTPGQDLMNGDAGIDTLKGFDGDDSLEGGEGEDTVYAGPGDDSAWSGTETIYGGPGNDRIDGVNVHGQDGEDAIGDEVWGEDPTQQEDSIEETITGGGGNDEIVARDDKSKDEIDCGAGSADLASFDKGPATSPDITVYDKVNTKTCERLDWTEEVPNPDCVKPWDNAKVRCIKGTNRSETLVGRDDPDPRIVDLMWGGGQKDTLRARRGIDGLAGGAGNDTLDGGPGDDGLFGDYNTHDPDRPEGSDKLYGEGGNDFIFAIDEKKDTISCGGGDDDWAQIDKGLDTVVARKDCEQIDNQSEGFYHWWRKSMRRKK
jgi:Ca2+-binding RTX toxin-like protein